MNSVSSHSTASSETAFSFSQCGFQFSQPKKLAKIWAQVLIDTIAPDSPGCFKPCLLALSCTRTEDLSHQCLVTPGAPKNLLEQNQPAFPKEPNTRLLHSAHLTRRKMLGNLTEQQTQEGLCYLPQLLHIL